MRTFAVFMHPMKGRKAVKEGFSWTAMVFGIAWAVFHRLWAVTLILVAVGTLSLLAEATLVGTGFGAGLLMGFLLDMAVSLYMGWKGNEWLRARLVSQGFEYVDSVEAGSPAKAASLVGRNALTDYAADLLAKADDADDADAAVKDDSAPLKFPKPRY